MWMTSQHSFPRCGLFLHPEPFLAHLCLSNLCLVFCGWSCLACAWGEVSWGHQVIPYTDMDTSLFFLNYKSKLSFLLLSLRLEFSQTYVGRMDFVLKVIPFLKIVGFQLWNLFQSVAKPPSHPHFIFQNMLIPLHCWYCSHELSVFLYS